MLYLASGSPRRQDLLKQIGVAFQQCVPEVDERVLKHETPSEYVSRLARLKAEKACQLIGVENSGDAVLAADTCVLVDDRILGKPRNEAEAAAMLAALSGRSHQVLSAVALIHGENRYQTLAVTEVRFRSLSAAEISAYWQTGEPRDKAGGYGIQGFGAVFVASIQGNYSTVVGLPLKETAELLQQAGIPLWQSPRLVFT